MEMSDVKKKDSQISNMDIKVAVNNDDDADPIGFDEDILKDHHRMQEEKSNFISSKEGRKLEIAKDLYHYFLRRAYSINLYRCGLLKQ